MKDELLLQALEEAVTKLDIKLSYEDLRKGEVATPGGICMLRGVRRIIIHKGLALKDRLEVLADLLSGVDTEGVHLVPEARKKIDAARERHLLKGAAGA